MYWGLSLSCTQSPNLKFAVVFRGSLQRGSDINVRLSADASNIAPASVSSGWIKSAGDTDAQVSAVPRGGQGLHHHTGDPAAGGLQIFVDLPDVGGTVALQVLENGSLRDSGSFQQDDLWTYSVEG